MNLDVLQGDLATAETRARRAKRIGELSLRAGDATTAVQVLGRAVDAGQTSPATLGLLAHARWLTGDAAGPGNCWSARSPPRRAIRRCTG
jgi:hypothetical protein